MNDDGDRKRGTTKDTVDSLSSLPVEVVYQILEHLILRDAARMSVLSRNWRDIWLSFPCITFDSQFLYDLNVRDKMSSESDLYLTMSKILFHHKGPIVKFTIDTAAYSGMDISPWISYISKGVREFSADASEPLKLSSHLFCCSKLRKLTLLRCTICIPPTFTEFSNLVSLELREVIASGDAYGSLIHRSSRLEELVMEDCKGFETIVIDSPVLRHLYFIGGWESICFKNAPNLTGAELYLGCLEDFDYRKARNLINFLASSCRIKQLRLGPIFHLLYPEGVTERLLSFNDLKTLEFDGISLEDPRGFSLVTNMMRSCPNLTNFVIYLGENIEVGQIVETGLNFTLVHLRWINIHDFTGEKPELKLIGFLLQNSPTLEKLCIKQAVCDSPLQTLKFYKELLRLRRASSKAEILLDDDW